MREKNGNAGEAWRLGIDGWRRGWISLELSKSVWGGMFFCFLLRHKQIIETIYKQIGVRPSDIAALQSQDRKLRREQGRIHGHQMRPRRHP